MDICALRQIPEGWTWALVGVVAKSGKSVFQKGTAKAFFSGSLL
ncbi:hypothetical protein [Methanosarcina acetivorans]|nr:hypothetical protein [Methanosarcina acetivorans]